MTEVRVLCQDFEERTLWESHQPASVEIRARFGAEVSSALVALQPRSSLPQVEIGHRLEVHLEGLLKFRGEIAELRTDSATYPLALRALRRPERVYRGTVRGMYENQTPTEILEQVLELSGGASLWEESTPASSRVLDRLDFPGIPLFHAVDLLAKLSGNWLWWIDWGGKLRLLPPSSPAEHVWYYRPDRMILHPWLIDEPVKNEFAFFGGVREGAEFLRFFTDEASRERYGGIEEHLFARSITSEAVYEYLRQAVLEQVPNPAVYRAIDRTDGDLSASFGERILLRGNPLPDLVGPRVYRIAEEEIRWSEGETFVRYHLAQGLESASRYAKYLDHDPQGENFVIAHLGPFALDVSALDSEAHLDA
jgi:hypothetical protein